MAISREAGSFSQASLRTPARECARRPDEFRFLASNDADTIRRRDLCTLRVKTGGGWVRFARPRYQLGDVESTAGNISLVDGAVSSLVDGAVSRQLESLLVFSCGVPLRFDNSWIAYG